ncbi:hypothetical protein TVAG_467990 [Trichomonas vaginalis G3]|uniref:Uncharacterized protein n=1 Tax=Trichomonas vaginalis (strain ATCC PRA-98 / G3) TaxID=412133 RepID=A2E0N8_TRIV3|nr:hypothetical protein TVAGG3_0073820 [Trichomonas vaginalis G3]EAY13783.1 hypothetical protein TVAG_467990 [Trichomonas vaginalis G3]KAI5542701.1 hypothetical protein TVAGG3_0073820 [Trichomonas vaginalis G3]|eukprot:XP_001326006.1 hypothetical protein [Trichomonas vaginalis G3]
MAFPSLRRSATADNFRTSDEYEIAPRLVPLESVPTPKDYLLRANLFLEKQKSQGFFQETDPDNNIIQHYMKEEPKVKETSTANLPKIISQKDNKLMSSHSVTKPRKRNSTSILPVRIDIDFWKKLEVVKQVIRELKKLPYSNEAYRDDTLIQFNNEMKQIIFEMQKEKLINPYTKTRIASTSAINYFTSEIKTIRKKIIFEKIQSKRIIYDKLDLSTQAEFPEDKPPVFVDSTVVTQEKLLQQQINEVSGLFPPSYQFHFDKVPTADDLLRENSMIYKPMAATQPVSPVRKLHVPTKKLERNRTSTAVQSAPVMNLSPLFAKSAENNLSRQEMISTYFDLYDPLKDRVPNQKNYSDQLYQISSSANFDFTTSNSEDVEVPAVDIDLSKKSYIEYSFDEKVPEYAIHENHEEEEKEIPQPVKVDLLQQPRHKIDHDIDMAMLLNSPLIATLLSNDDDDEEDLHARINKVFDELGFSAKQKLDLALKYSDTESNGITLTDAVFN